MELRQAARVVVGIAEAFADRKSRALYLATTNCEEEANEAQVMEEMEIKKAESLRQMTPE